MTLDTVADESRKMADGVARSPSRLCTRDGEICCYGDALSTIFLLACFCALLPTFLFRFFLYLLFPASRYVYLLRVPSSVEQPSATLSKYHHLYPTSSRNYFVVILLVFFRSSYFSGGVFFVVLSYPVR